MTNKGVLLRALISFGRTADTVLAVARKYLFDWANLRILDPLMIWWRLSCREQNSKSIILLPIWAQGFLPFLLLLALLKGFCKADHSPFGHRQVVGAVYDALALLRCIPLRSFDFMTVLVEDSSFVKEIPFNLCTKCEN